MFTGIIEGVGKVKALKKTQNGGELYIFFPEGWTEIVEGESIAINGVCLTALPETESLVRFDLLPETSEATNIKFLNEGARVNLERALAFGARMGGHFVTGHVDGMAEILNIEVREENQLWTITAGEHLLKYLYTKASVALDGVSLTVQSVGEKSFNVALIPHTLEATCFSGHIIGTQVNVENDCLARMTERLLSNRQGKELDMTVDDLRREGF